MINTNTRVLALLRKAKRKASEIPLAPRILVILLVSLIVLIGIIVLTPYKLLRLIGRQLAKVPALLRGLYDRFMHRHVENVGLSGGLAIVLLISYGLYRLDPESPTLHLAMVQVIVLAPVLYFVALHVPIWTYKHLLPEQFKSFMSELGQKIQASALPPLDELLDQEAAARIYVNPILVADFKLKYHTRKFLFRCVRYVLFALPLFVLFRAMLDMLALTLNLQPR